jgi:hypothetical protein
MKRKQDGIIEIHYLSHIHWKYEMEDSMRKIILSILMITLLVTLTGCNKGKNNNEDNSVDITPTTQPIVTLPPEVTPGEEEIEGSVGEEETFTLEDYFPMEADTEYVYEGEGNEYASYRRFIDYIDVANKKLQTRTNNGGTETVRVIQIKDGRLSVIYLVNESYYRANFMEQEAADDAEVLLMEPFVQGTQWTLSDGRKRSISGVKVPVSTKYGSFDTLEVTTEGEDSTSKDYYAAGVGLVKSVFLTEGMEVTSTLSSVNKSAVLKQPITLFYPDADEKIYAHQTELDMKTGTEVSSVLEEVMKKVPPKDTYLPLISANTKLNNIALEDGTVVHVDFSSEFVTGMNAGAGYELLILQGVTNTLGNYYGASKVLITVDGKPYESGHILMKEDEVLEVDMKKVIQ